MSWSGSWGIPKLECSSSYRLRYLQLIVQTALFWLQMELTLMMVAERPIPVAQLRDKFLERQSIVLRQLKRQEHLLEPRLQPEHLLLLARIKRRFTRGSLS